MRLCITTRLASIVFLTFDLRRVVQQHQSICTRPTSTVETVVRTADSPLFMIGKALLMLCAGRKQCRDKCKINPVEPQLLNYGNN